MSNAGRTLPIVYVPHGFEHVWAWFFDINLLIDRAGYGYCRNITARDYLDWERLSGEIVHPHEYDILRAMDAAYVAEMNKIIQAGEKSKDG